MQNIQPGIYQHYKGSKYEVIGVAKNKETMEEMVVYRARYKSETYGDDALWVRSVDDFCGVVTIDGEKQPRFQKIDS